MQIAQKTASGRRGFSAEVMASQVAGECLARKEVIARVAPGRISRLFSPTSGDARLPIRLDRASFC